MQEKATADPSTPFHFGFARCPVAQDDRSFGYVYLVMTLVMSFGDAIVLRWMTNSLVIKPLKNASADLRGYFSGAKAPSILRRLRHD